MRITSALIFAFLLIVGVVSQHSGSGSVSTEYKQAEAEPSKNSVNFETHKNKKDYGAQHNNMTPEM